MALQGTDGSLDTDTSCSPSARRHILWPNYPFTVSCRQHCPTMKTLLPPKNLLPCIILITPFQLCSQSASSYWSQLSCIPLGRQPNTSPGAYPSAPFTSLHIPPCSHAAALLLLFTAQCFQTTPPFLFFSVKPQAPYLIGTLSIPVSSGTRLPQPAEPQCLADRRKTSFPPMCTTVKMVSHPWREE